MRIVSGIVGGRTVLCPDTEGVRPTKDRVREAIFNSLASHGWVEDCSFLDLFAGSGALGLEALSRGASRCTFVDNDRDAIATVRENIRALDLSESATVRQADWLGVVDSLDHHDVALLDPPYEFEHWPDLLNRVRSDLAVIESDHPVDPGDGWQILKEKRYAGTVVVIARRPSGAVTGSEGNEEDVRP